MPDALRHYLKHHWFIINNLHPRSWFNRKSLADAHGILVVLLEHGADINGAYSTHPSTHIFFYQWHFRSKGYCHCLRLSFRLYVCLWSLHCLHYSSQIWARITKFAPNMHHEILSVGIENGGHWPWPSRSFYHFDSEFLEIWLVRLITHHRFGLESPNLHQTCILGYSRLVLNMEVIDFDLQGYFGNFDLKF